MVAVFGTMAAGILHVYLCVPYIFSAIIYGVTLTVIFVLWYLSEKTLSVHSIYTRRRELFYWAAVLATFALGTAAGDMMAVSFQLGFFASGILFAVVFAIPGVAYRLFGLSEIVAFWFAYIITRPLGASFADWLAVPPSQGGLNLGKGTISVALWILIIAFWRTWRSAIEMWSDPQALSPTPARASRRETESRWWVPCCRPQLKLLCHPP
jgi:uncharacterized membrane-anchored protein